MRTAYERFQESMGGSDAEVSIALSTLSLLIDSSLLSRDKLDRIIEETIERLTTRITPPRAMPVDEIIVTAYSGGTIVVQGDETITVSPGESRRFRS